VSRAGFALWRSHRTAISTEAGYTIECN